MQIPSAQAVFLLDIARESIRSALLAVEAANAPPCETSDPILLQPAGCFVSLHRAEDRALRGCVGRLETRDALFDAVRLTAAGVLDDPRFADSPVTLDELPSLELEISVVSPLRPADGPMDFDPLNDGIYLTFSDRAGCFLPQVARQTGWTREQLLDRLCVEKLGLPSIAWRHADARLMRFTTCILGPEPFAVPHPGQNTDERSVI